MFRTARFVSYWIKWSDNIWDFEYRRGSRWDKLKEILNEVELSESEFLEKMDAMFDEFINGHSLLGQNPLLTRLISAGWKWLK